MTENGEKLYDLMISKGYPENFAMAIASQMQTEYTSKRMMGYISRSGLLSGAEVADEMFSILEERDRLIKKHIAVHAQQKINELYNDGILGEEEDIDGSGCDQ